MWEIVSRESLGHRWPTPNNWDRGEGEEEEFSKYIYHVFK